MNEDYDRDLKSADRGSFASLFSGFGGADLGAMAAGLKPVWAVEYEADIAAVYCQNIGDHVTVGDILNCDPADFERVQLLHTSPPCPNFSSAKAGAEETPHDIALAEKVAEFITVLLPDFFTLENVFQYRNSQSWIIIAQALLNHGYQFNYYHVCAADYGVPQTRRRMIVIARRDGLRPQLPPATHAESPEAGLFGTLKKWVGWHEAIEDLIPTLPESEFAKWQLERLPEELKESLFFNNQTDYGDGLSNTSGKEPAPTIVSAIKTTSAYRAFIVDGQQTSPTKDGREANVNDEKSPMFTVNATQAKGLHKAFVVNSAFPGSNGKKHYLEDEPHFTIDTTSEGRSTAYASGRIVQMTTRALARFQSFPDTYILPENKTLACRGIGNACPPLLMQRIYEGLL